MRLAHALKSSLSGWALGLLALGMGSLACDTAPAADSDATGGEAIVAKGDGLACEAPAPLCLSSCQDPHEARVATCSDGAWRCATGVRADLCCDPVYNPGPCDEWSAPCTLAAPCPAGYTCVESRLWPLPSASGTCRLGQWQIPETLTRCDERTFITLADLLRDRPLSMAHIEGVVRVFPRCEDKRCPPDNPCCQQCTGSYELELRPDEALPYHIAVRARSVACAGTNCSFSCAPLQPGRRYRIWGLWSPDGAPGKQGLLYLAGFCGELDTPSTGP